MTNKIIIAILFLLCSSIQYAQEKVYTDYKFEGNSNITVSALKNKSTTMILTTDENGTLHLKESKETHLQQQIDDLQKQLTELKNQFNAGLSQATTENTDFEFKIFPNPSNGQFTFEFKQIIPDELVVHDIKGNEIIQIPISSNTAKIDLQSLNTGYYIIHIMSNKKTLGLKNILIK